MKKFITFILILFLTLFYHSNAQAITAGSFNQSASANLYCGTWQLIEDKQFSVDASSYTFSDLHGNTDDEYRLIWFLVGAKTTNYPIVRLNNDSSTNYGNQYIDGISSNTYAGRGTSETAFWTGFYSIDTNELNLTEMIIKAKSGTARTCITRTAHKVSGTTVSAFVLLGQIWNNTVDELTSISVTTIAGNGTAQAGIKAGSRVLLFKRTLSGSSATVGMKFGSLNVKGSVNAGVMQKIYETDLNSATTQVNITGLNGDTDIFYEIFVRPVYNTGAPGTNITFNTDTGDNYGVQQVYGVDTTIGSSRSTTGTNCVQMGDISTANSVAFSRALIFAPSGTTRVVLRNSLERAVTTTVTVMRLTGASWNNSINNITSIQYQADTANGLGAGTHIEVWALRKK